MQETIPQLEARISALPAFKSSAPGLVKRAVVYLMVGKLGPKTDKIKEVTGYDPFLLSDAINRLRENDQLLTSTLSRSFLVNYFKDDPKIVDDVLGQVVPVTVAPPAIMPKPEAKPTLPAETPVPAKASKTMQIREAIALIAATGESFDVHVIETWLRQNKGFTQPVRANIANELWVQSSAGKIVCVRKSGPGIPGQYVKADQDGKSVATAATVCRPRIEANAFNGEGQAVLLTNDPIDRRIFLLQGEIEAKERDLDVLWRAKELLTA